MELAVLTNQKSTADNSLAGVLKNADVFIGVSGPKIINREAVKKMNPKPVIFALANPMPEIMPDEALAGGAFIVASTGLTFPTK